MHPCFVTAPLFPVCGIFDSGIMAFTIHTLMQPGTPFHGQCGTCGTHYSHVNDLPKNIVPSIAKILDYDRVKTVSSIVGSLDSRS
jgi:hypothetical protein